MAAYKYLSELNRALTPGCRVWICGMRLNPSGTKFIRNMPPTYAELRTSTNEHMDAYNSCTRGIHAAVPVENGRLNWRKATGVKDLRFFPDEASARLCYQDLLDKNIAAIDARIDQLNAMARRIEKIKQEQENRTI